MTGNGTNLVNEIGKAPFFIDIFTLRFLGYHRTRKKLERPYESASGSSMGSRPPSPSHLAPKRDDLFLDDGSRVAVIGGGPAGSFFTYFLFEMAERIGMELAVDIYEPRDFTNC